MAMGKTVPWGRIWVAPSLAELPKEATATGESGGDAAGAQAILQDAMGRPERWIRYNTLWALSKMGLTAAPFRGAIEKALSDDVSDVQVPACKLTARIDEPTPEGVKGLMVALDDEFAAPEAGTALNHLLRNAAPARTAAAKPIADALFKMQGRRQNQYVVLALKADIQIPFERFKEEYLESPQHHWYFLGIVIEHGPYAVETVLPFAVEELLKHSDNDTREHASNPLGAIGSLAHKALPELERLAKEDPHEEGQGRRIGRGPEHQGPALSCPLFRSICRFVG